MEEAHTILHQITTLLGMKQCTSTQIIGVCLEFWVGGAVAVGALKVKQLVNFKKKIEAQSQKVVKSKKKRKKKKQKKKKK